MLFPIGIVSSIANCPTIPIMNKNHKYKLLISKNMLIIIPQNIHDIEIYIQGFLNHKLENTSNRINVIGIVKINVSQGFCHDVDMSNTK